MKISIITISYNSAATIARTINSVLSQNYSNLEYIVIDGASTDGTIDIIRSYGHQIAYFISEPDQGISDAFNKGIRAATGDIIGILNSDDWYEPGALARAAQEFAQPGNDFLIGALRYWPDHDSSFVVAPDKDYKKYISYKMPHLNHPAAFFRADVYRSIGDFDRRYRYAMDYDFFLRVERAGKRALFIDTVLANMSLHGASDRHAVLAYRESCRIAPNKILATLYFIYSLFKYYCRRLLIGLNLKAVLLFIQKKKYRN